MALAFVARGFKARLCMLCLAWAASSAAQAQAVEPLVVALNLEFQGDAPLAKNGVSLPVLRQLLHWHMKNGLESAGANIVVREPSANELVAPGAARWIRDNKARYVINGEIVEPRSGPHGQGRWLTWHMRKVNVDQSDRLSYSSLIENVSHPVSMSDGTGMMNDIEKVAAAVRGQVMKTLGIGGAKRILVSCFRVKSLPKAHKDREAFNYLISVLPYHLAASLNGRLGARGYKTRGLDSDETAALCAVEEKSADLKALADLKRDKDCVIGGVMRMFSQQRFEVQFSVEWQESGPILVEAFQGDIEQTSAADVSDHVLRHLPAIMGAQ